MVEEEDAGVTDKRLLVIEGEFAHVLAVMRREGNTLSTVLRELWDHGTYGSLTKHNPVSATDAHVSVVGHITERELRERLTGTDKPTGSPTGSLSCASGVPGRCRSAAIWRRRRSRYWPAACAKRSPQRARSKGT